VSRGWRYASASIESNGNVDEQRHIHAKAETGSDRGPAERCKNLQVHSSDCDTPLAQPVPDTILNLSARNTRLGRALLIAVLPLLAILAWLIASHHFPETMHQVRLVMILLATGGPNE
jgi:hypothetical protein